MSPTLTITERAAVAGMLLAERVKALDQGPWGDAVPPAPEEWVKATVEWLRPLGDDGVAVLHMLLLMLEAAEQIEIHRAACEASGLLRAAIPGAEGSPIEYSVGGESMAPEDPRALRALLYPWVRWQVRT